MQRQGNRTVISARDLSLIASSLTRLIHNGNANCALLLDSSGHVVRANGETKGLDTIALGALLAGNFGSAREIARLLQEDSFNALFQQGTQASVYTQQVGTHYQLSVIFDRRTQVGLVKSLVQRCATELDDLLRKTWSGSKKAEAVVSQEWRLAADNALDRALGERAEKG